MKLYYCEWLEVGTMDSKYINVWLSLFFVFISNVDCQVCTRRVMVTLTTRTPYLYTYREQYQTRCWYGGTCSKTRIRSNVGYRTGLKREEKVVKYCCDGYIQDDKSTDDDLFCNPICWPSCNNGFCKSPGECECNIGYLPDHTNPRNCVPHCEVGCENGICVAPNICECNFGYSLNGTCQPICTEPCENGICSAPGTCECLDGFRKTEDNTCKPYCSQGCVHGVCIQPEICDCDEGYVLEDEQCVVHCNIDCGNGTCVATDECECDPGYTFENNTCQPICPDICENGFCGAPFTCICNPGYSLQWGNCHPYCSKECGNGKCVAPETCECESGYRFNNSCESECCEPYCSKPCVHGSCIEPDVCDCNDGYKIDFMTDTCVPDCIYYCGNGTCVGPNVCECHPGYEEKEAREFYDEAVCEPICINCGGNCIKPHTCECNLEFETRHEAADGGECECFENCSDISRQCVRTICIPKSIIETSTEVLSSTLIKGQESYLDYGLMDESFDGETVSTYVADSWNPKTEVTGGYASSSHITEKEIIKSNHVNIYTAKQQKEIEQSRSLTWIYVAVALILLLITTVVIILIVKRNTISNLFRGGSYVVEDKLEDASTSSRSIDMRFSTVKNNEKDS